MKFVEELESCCALTLGELGADPKRCLLFLFTLLFASLPFIAQAQIAIPPKKQHTVAKAAASVKVPDVPIQGQVFVVTNGGINIKLALVNVAAYREKDLLAQLDWIWDAGSDERAYAATQVLAAKGEITAAGDRMKDATDRAVYIAQTFRPNLGAMSPTEALRPFAVAEAEAMLRLADHRSAVKKWEDERKMEAGLSTPRHQIEKLTNPLTASKTDADGKFELTLPAGQYVLVATGRRMAGESTELYEWMIRVDAEKPAKVMLSNDNLAGNRAGCAECLRLPIRYTAATSSGNAKN
jgi:hypothetical protein